MQKYTRFAKKAKVIVTAFFIVVLLLSFSINTFALTPPIDDGSAPQVYTGSPPEVSDAEAIIAVVRSMYNLNYFQFGSYMYCYYDGSQMVLAVSRVNTGDVTVDGSSLVSDSVAKNLYIITEYGFRYLTSHSGTHTVPLSWVLCYLSDDTFVDNLSNFTVGTSTSNAFRSTASAWLEFYLKVFNYDQNLQSSYNDGYNAGETAGAQSGYLSGFQAGFEEGEQSGYQSGYDSGHDVGYTQGETAGYNRGYNVGFSEGYEVGVSDGGGGDSVVIIEQLDISSIISSLPQAVRNILDSTFGFELFGINIASTLTAVLLVAIVAFVVRWLMSR